VLSRHTIGNHVWNYDYEGESNIIDVYIRNLRKKMDCGGNKLIHTVRGAGYVLREDA
jgi:DNA-binding response OmpR family regulator